MKNQIYDHLEKNNFKPFLFIKKNEKESAEILVWAKNQEDAYQQIKTFQNKVKMSEIKEITVLEAKKINKKQENDLKKAQASFDKKMATYVKNFEGLINEIGQSLTPKFDNLLENFDSFFDDDFIEKDYFLSFIDKKITHKNTNKTIKKSKPVNNKNEQN